MSCMICSDELTPVNRVELACRHSSCRSCIFQVVRVNTYGFDIGMIRCPDLDCRRPISQTTIEEVAQLDSSGKTLELFRSAKRQQVLLQNPRLCECPKCGGLCSRPTSTKSKATCAKCQLNFCAECSLAATDSHDCPVKPADFFGELSQTKRVLNCPLCCLRIEKIDGCNQMRCPICKTEFCWVCGRKKGLHHYAYWNVLGCPGQALRNQAPTAHRIGSLLVTILAAVILLWLSAWVFRWQELRSGLAKVAVLDLVVVGLKRTGWKGPSDAQYILLHIANQLLGDELWQKVGI